MAGAIDDSTINIVMVIIIIMVTVRSGLGLGFRLGLWLAGAMTPVVDGQ